MTSKEIILDFINLIFLLALVVFCITFFIVGDRFAEFTQLLQALMPMSVFGIFYLIRIKLTRDESKKRKKEMNDDLTLSLDFRDKFWSEAVVFLTPIAMCIIFYLSEGEMTTLEIIQASIVFLILFFWNRYLLSKTR